MGEPAHRQQNKHPGQFMISGPGKGIKRQGSAAHCLSSSSTCSINLTLSTNTKPHHSLRGILTLLKRIGIDQNMGKKVKYLTSNSPVLIIKVHIHGKEFILLWEN